jgi:hypothetical protein
LADAENMATAPGAALTQPSAEAPETTYVDLDDARLDVRLAGYCVYCDRIVERADDDRCPEGHPARGIAGRIVLIDDDAVPALPRFNWAAFLIPFLWGPAHGQWVGAIFLPIWLFADSIVSSARSGGAVSTVAALVVASLTLLFGWWFAKRANGLAFRRVIATQTAEEFARRQRIWSIAAVLVATGLLGWAVWFRVVIAPTLGTL